MTTSACSASRCAWPRATFGGLQIQHGALLAAIPGDPRRMAAKRIAGRRLELGHVGAEISQHRRSQCASHTPTEVQNHKSVARSGHVFLLKSGLPATISAVAVDVHHR